MEIDIEVYNLLNILFQVILWSLIISAPAIILTIEMYLYERYKKWKDMEIKEKEKIIVGKAKKINQFDNEIERQSNEIKKLKIDLEILTKQKKALNNDLNIDNNDTDNNDTDNNDLKSKSVIELKKICKDKGLKMYSKKNKSQLIKLLEDIKL